MLRLAPVHIAAADRLAEDLGESRAFAIRYAIYAGLDALAAKAAAKR